MEFDIEIANIIVLNEVRKWYNPKPLKYKALERFKWDINRAYFKKASVIIPKINKDELGVKWDDMKI